MEAILEPLTKSTKFVQYVRELNGILQTEQIKRLAFCEWLTDQKAEFINGEVVVHSPEKLKHTVTRQRLSRILGMQAIVRAIGMVLDEKALVRLDRNDYMPDVSFWRAEVAQTFEPAKMFYPPPDLVCEVLSPTTEKIDRGDKFDDYARNGVREYWLIDVDARFVEQYVLRDGRFELVAKVTTGNVVSVCVPEFVVPIAALFEDEAQLDAVEAILAQRANPRVTPPPTT